jgi:hypothetical protein
MFETDVRAHSIALDEIACPLRTDLEWFHVFLGA